MCESLSFARTFAKRRRDMKLRHGHPGETLLPSSAVSQQQSALCDFSVPLSRTGLYQRSSRLFGALALARGDGRYARLMRQFAHVNLLILDDWGPEPLTAEQRRDLLEIVEDRYNCGSLIITSQVPVDRWYEIVGDPTLADAILDRLVHNSHRIALTGKSRRKPETVE
jgi:DNA replication protein DnaC